MLPFQETELLLRAKDGDHEAFAQIYERYAPTIFRYIYQRVGQLELAEDLHADVFLRVYEGLARYEDRGWPLSSWLYRIAHDRLVDSVRRRPQWIALPLETCRAQGNDTEKMVGTRLELEELHRSLDALTEEQRDVIRLRFGAELSIQEVAMQLGRSEGAVKALQHRAIQSLARRLNVVRG
ncbi:MAG: sigma-70 family RNA polymerase sigma factor [Roseiflexaceae bacterium]|nr:sigma-70 family RNA polymerase sigma factor [Roseiflexaceae bacterium]